MSHLVGAMTRDATLAHICRKNHHLVRAVSSHMPGRNVQLRTPCEIFFGRRRKCLASYCDHHYRRYQPFRCLHLLLNGSRFWGSFWAMGTVIGVVRDPAFATAVAHLDHRQSEMHLLPFCLWLLGLSLVQCVVQCSMTAVVVGGCNSCCLPGSPSIHDASFALVWGIRLWVCL